MQKFRNILLIICLMPLLINGQQKISPEAGDMSLNEDIILSTDRNFYLAGEKIWFSATIAIGGKTLKTDFSQVLYVELISLNQNQDIISKHQISKNKVNGFLDIPEGLHTGYYVMRAYTTYQRNEGPSSFSSKVLTIINPVVPLVKIDNKNEKQVEIVAMNYNDREKDNFGLFIPRPLLRENPVVWIGVKDSSLVYPVRYFENGLAYFQIDSSQKTGSILIFFKSENDTISKTISLPDEKRFDLSIEQKGNSMRIDGSANEKDLQSTESFSLFILNDNHEIIQNSKVDIKGGKFSRTIADQKMQHGLYYAMLKDKNEKIISTDAFYFRQAIDEIFQISTDKENYAQRELVTLHINAPGKPGEIDNFSVSVVTKGSVNPLQNIPLYLVSNPLLFNSFLQNLKIEGKVLTKQLEILLAWYAKILVDDPPDLIVTENESSDTYYVESRGVNLSGTVRHKQTNLPAKGIDVYLSVFDDHPQLQIYKTETDGSFRFSLRHIKDLTNIYLVFDAGEQDDLEMLVNRDHSNLFPPYTKVDYLPDTSIKQFIEEAYINAQVTENYQDQFIMTEHETLAYRFHDPAATIHLDDYVDMQSFEAVLNELVPYTRVKRKEKVAYLEVLDGLTNIAYNKPLILLDDLPVFNVDELLKIHPNKIESVEVINSTYIYGDHIIKGIVMIYTRTENFGGFSLPASFTAIEYNSTRSQTSFVPVIHNEKAKSSDRVPDFRNLLYWNPQINPVSKDTTFTFYTSDHKGEYQIYINGILNNGQPFSQQSQITVK